MEIHKLQLNFGSRVISMDTEDVKISFMILLELLVNWRPGKDHRKRIKLSALQVNSVVPLVPVPVPGEPVPGLSSVVSREMLDLKPRL